MDFDLKAVTRQVIASTDDPWTLDDLIDAVDAQTPARVRREAYRQALREFVRVVMGQHERVVAEVDEPDDETELESDVRRPVPDNVATSRVALLRAGYRARIHAAPGIWKRLGDCTPDEVEFAAQENRRMAAANTAMADRYERLAKLMRDVGAATVADLDPADVGDLAA
jgi:hypothetical protein